MELITSCVHSDGFISGWVEAGNNPQRAQYLLSNSNLSCLGAPIPQDAVLFTSTMGSVGGWYLSLYVHPVEFNCQFPEIYGGTDAQQQRDEHSNYRVVATRNEFRDRLSDWVSDFARTVSGEAFAKNLLTLIVASRNHVLTESEVTRALSPDYLRAHGAPLPSSAVIGSGPARISYPYPFCFTLTGSVLLQLWPPHFSQLPQLSLNFGWQNY